MKQGKYIVVEGDNGAGKTVQLVRLRDHLVSLGIEVEIVREPGGDPFAEALREILKHSAYAITPVAETLAFSAARANLLQNIVRPLLDSGTWVLTDRSYISTQVIQGEAHGLSSAAFRRVVEYGAQVAPPDLTIIIDVSLEMSESRQLSRKLRPDRFALGPAFRPKVNEAYRALPESVTLVHVDGHGTQAQVAKRIQSQILRLLG